MERTLQRFISRQGDRRAYSSKNRYAASFCHRVSESVNKWCFFRLRRKRQETDVVTEEIFQSSMLPRVLRSHIKLISSRNRLPERRSTVDALLSNRDSEIETDVYRYDRKKFRFLSKRSTDAGKQPDDDNRKTYLFDFRGCASFTAFSL